MEADYITALPTMSSENKVQILQALLDKKFSEAYVLLSKILPEYNGLPKVQILTLRAYCAKMTRDIEKLKENVDMMTDVMPKSAYVCNWKGTYLLTQRLWQEALDVFEYGLANNRERYGQTGNWNLKALCLYHLGRIDDALASYDLAIQKSIFANEKYDLFLNKMWTYVLLDRPVEIIAAYEVVMKEDKQLYNRGEAQLQIMYAIASLHNIALFKSLPHCPKSYYPYNYVKGFLYEKIGQYGNAIGEYKLVADIDATIFVENMRFKEKAVEAIQRINKRVPIYSIKK